ncbi:MAG: RCC1 domain-containing protein, partial [Gemmatimonadales bacterium]
DAGWEHTCAVTTSSRAFCWGDNHYYQLGDGTTATRRWWPRAVAGGLSFRRVTAGWKHTCGETPTNRAYCWGWNAFGQLGDGTDTPRQRPVAVSGGLSFGQLTAAGSGSHTCGKTTAGLAYCWGYGEFGQVGDGTADSPSIPTPVAGPM